MIAEKCLRRVSLSAAACALFCCGPDAGIPEPAAPSAVIEEASGVHVGENELLIVDDSAPNAYFRVRIPADAGPVIALNDHHPERISFPILTFVDLESIDQLADGRLVVLSERMRGLVGRDGPIVEYDYPLAEVARRGLEGIAVRPLPNATSRVAVIWEGGYPDRGSLHPDLEVRAGLEPFAPIIFVHDIPAGSNPGRVRWRDGLHRVILDVPLPTGAVPAAQRFRAPDLAWYRWPDQREDEWGFLVLLGSQSAVAPPEFLHHVIQRFDMTGKPVGDPLDIASVAPPEIGHANWEGLAWRETGKSVILVHEGRGELQAHALVVELPAEWQY